MLAGGVWRSSWVAPGIGRRICSAPGERDESVPRCQAGRTGDQATDPQTLGKRPHRADQRLRTARRWFGCFQYFLHLHANHLAAIGERNLASTLLASAAALAVTATAALALGRLSDAVGRRPVAIWSTLALAVLAAPASVLASSSRLGLW